jgi:hypothetical protein
MARWAVKVARAALRALGLPATVGKVAPLVGLVARLARVA